MSSMDVDRKYDYDLLVLGGGSGGLAAYKQALLHQPKLRVALLDYVTPTPHGTSWGLGGTCVNVGCIPKKLMHYAGTFRHTFEHAASLGWQFPKGGLQHSWETLVETVGNKQKSSNWDYKKELKTNGVNYINAFGHFIDAHTIEAVAKGKPTTRVTAERILIAVGCRPRYPEIPGAELGISSDDLFSLKKNPGKVLISGAGYIALECGGFLNELGNDVSIAMRSVPLRGFDQQSAHQVCELLERGGVRFFKPAQITKLEKRGDRIQATLVEDGKTIVDDFDTVIHAIGRAPLLRELKLDNAGVATKDGYIITDEQETTSAKHIWAIGDAALNRPQLTPVAIAAGRLWADRVFGGGRINMDYQFVPTTVFTPTEYGSVGYAQEQADTEFGKDNLESLVIRFGSHEQSTTTHVPKPTRSSKFTGKALWARAHALEHKQPWDEYPLDSFEQTDRDEKYLKFPCLAKLITIKKTGRIVGLHYVGFNAGEVLQGFSLAVKHGLTKAAFQAMVGIHPTSAEEFAYLSITLQSGKDFLKASGCCG